MTDTNPFHLVFILATIFLIVTFSVNVVALSIHVSGLNPPQPPSWPSFPTLTTNMTVPSATIKVYRWESAWFGLTGWYDLETISFLNGTVIPIDQYSLYTAVVVANWNGTYSGFTVDRGTSYQINMAFSPISGYVDLTNSMINGTGWTITLDNPLNVSDHQTGIVNFGHTYDWKQLTGQPDKQFVLSSLSYPSPPDMWSAITGDLIFAWNVLAYFVLFGVYIVQAIAFLPSLFMGMSWAFVFVGLIAVILVGSILMFLRGSSGNK